MLRHIGSIAGIVLISALSWWLYVAELKYIQVTPLLNDDIETWERLFMDGALILCYVSAVFSLFWYALAQLGLKVVDWKSAGRRTWWVGLWLGVFAVTLAIGYFHLKDTVEAGYGWAVACYVINGVLCYYLSTLLLSPVAFKYTPWGAMKVRRYW
ncbi:membrane protein [Candidatus Magnetobacterium bavaricum]|uniref:Membrane protein n=1 Tax=Candidatus Magnetobacterium bavaricum TaxID=29290 RepID=A0A0F3GJY0_9BACT|nr:membrane protein [Candidatus Magnetobacterium bavaricum]